VSASRALQRESHGEAGAESRRLTMGTLSLSVILRRAPPWIAGCPPAGQRPLTTRPGNAGRGAIVQPRGLATLGDLANRFANQRIPTRWDVVGRDEIRVRRDAWSGLTSWYWLGRVGKGLCGFRSWCPQGRAGSSPVSRTPSHQALCRSLFGYPQPMTGDRRAAATDRYLPHR
jgi:hypothetical protein